jgi:hypothetical protein
MRDGRALQRNLEHVLTRVFGGFFHGWRNFIGLPVPQADVAATIACHDQRPKAECSAALDNLRAAINANDGRLDAPFFTLTTTATATASLALTVTRAASAAATLLAIPVIAATTSAAAATSAGDFTAAGRCGRWGPGCCFGCCRYGSGRCRLLLLGFRCLLLFFSHKSSD